MKVLQINSVCGTGSTGRIVTDIHKILIGQGHESYIAYGRGKEIKIETAMRIGTKKDNYSHVALTRLFDKHGMGSKKATLQLIEKINRMDPDVIHLHNLHGYYINIEILFNYLKNAKHPVLWTLHDCWTFTGHCSHFDYIGCDKWKKGCRSCPQTNEYPKSILIDNSKSNFIRKKEIFNGVDNLTLVTASKWLQNLVQESFLNNYPVKQINNGIDLNKFKPTQSHFRRKYNIENKYLILGVAHVWGERKGFYHFIELSKRLKEDEVIVLVGLNEKQKKELPVNIIGIKRTNDIRELAEIYSAADVFVNLTLEEVMGLTNVEALACGTPVITYNSGGSKECVDKDCGVIIEKGDISKLVSTLKMFKKTGKSRYFEASQKRANLYYNKNDKFLEYTKLYEQLINT
ncbi:glycosyltransferase [Pseudalkalibacillus sp. SCS-8]|uniref:glycosyltransferase n=1 Tax=Pseudalkalibacillus nanhaiensis TaxID=3115291 RepID=UPI0032DAD9B5